MEGFPLRPSESFFEEREEIKKGKKIMVAFGMKAQGNYDFVERALKDGAGWNAIAKAIGWINFGAFKAYYRTKYKELFDKHNLILLDPCESETEGFLLYDSINNTWKEIEETQPRERDSIGFPIPKISRVQFLLRTGHSFEDFDKTLKFDFHMDEKMWFNDICCHARMKKEDEIILIECSDIYNFGGVVKQKENEGYKVISGVYFDLPTIEDNEKLRIDKKGLEFLRTEYGITV